MTADATQSFLARRARTIQSLFWILFLIWTFVGFLVMPLEIGEARVSGWIHDAAVQDAIVRFLRMSDAIWIVLAAINTYFCLVANEGIATARKWATMILVSSAVLEWVGAVSGFPFGPYVYTDNLGVRIGGVLPFTIPLAWLVILITGRYVMLRVFPRANHWQLSLGVAMLAVVTDWNLEFVAWKVRAYWIWYPRDLQPPHTPPWQNYASWFAASFILSFALGENRAAVTRAKSAKPILILALINALFLCVRAARL
jgi:uncharacterized membrane protein